MTSPMKRRADGQIVPMTEAEIASMQPSLDDRREQCAAAVDALRDQKLSQFGYDFGAPNGILHLQLRDTDDRTNWLTLDGACTKLLMVGRGSDVLPLRTAENVTLMLPASQLSMVLSAMAQYGSTVMAVSWALKDAVRASPDPEAVPITEGWPQ